MQAMKFIFKRAALLSLAGIALFLSACGEKTPEQIAAENRKKADIAIRRAQVLLFDEKNDDAISILEKAYEECGASPELCEQLAYAYSQQGNFPMAAMYFEKASDMKDGDAELLINAARSYERSSVTDSAAKAYEKYLKIKPQDGMAWKSLSQAYMKQEKFQEALNALMASVKADGRFRSEAFERDGAHAVHLSADFEAAKTADALVGREGEGGRRRVGAVTVHKAPREARDVEPHGLRDRLEFAVAVARALRAALAVVGKEEFRLELTHAAQLRARGAHAKAFLHARVAGRDGAGAVLLHDFHETHAAGPRTVVKRREFAERRNENPFAAGDLENRFAFGEADGDVVQKCFHLPLPDQSSNSLFPGMGRSVETAKIR